MHRGGHFEEMLYMCESIHLQSQTDTEKESFINYAN